ncbi:transcription elongation factor [Actinoplanes sp. TBRC 11911]|uniref:MOSC domain-containing protein n=1 Tax=Actinoplanes sp. TBRC 11911 TaxID=2729386 RepID=UPI00145C4AF7|nr:MOSC domain-containing protein [Actinoplanes sp. TBRC 11911]NMO57209.1 transcription elongation factor [Actinoplanes sp. TBRC 11911]
MSSRRGSVVSVSCNDVYSFTKPVRDEIVLVAGFGVEGDVHAGVRVRHRSRVKADPTQPNLRQVHLMQAELFGEVGEKGYAVTPGDLGENVTTSGIDLLALPLGTILRFGPPAGETAGPGAEAHTRPAAGGGATARRSEGPAIAAEPATAVRAVLAAASAAVLDESTTKAAAAVATAAARETGDDPRPAVVIAGLRNPCAQINGFQQGLLKEVVGHDENGSLVRKAGIMAVVLRGGHIRAGDHVHVEFPPPPHAPLERV